MSEHNRLSRSDLRNAALTLENDSKFYEAFRNAVINNGLYRTTIRDHAKRLGCPVPDIMDREQLRRYLCGSWSLPDLGENAGVHERIRCGEPTIDIFGDELAPANPELGWDYSPVWAADANGNATHWDNTRAAEAHTKGWKVQRHSPQEKLWVDIYLTKFPSTSRYRWRPNDSGTSQPLSPTPDTSDLDDILSTTPITETETIMTTITNTAAIEITTKTLVNGLDISNFKDSEIYDLIAAQEAEIDKLDAIKTKPKKLVAEIEKRKAGIQALVDYLDSKAD